MMGLRVWCGVAVCNVLWTLPCAAQEAAEKTPPAQEDEQSEATAAKAPAANIEARLREVVAQPGGLTAAEVGRRASQTSYAALSAEEDVRAGHSDVNRVLADGAPRLDLIARYTRLSEVELPTFGPGTGAFVGTQTQLPPGQPIGNTPVFSIPASAFTFPQVLNQYHLQAALKVPISDYIFSTGHAYSAAKHSTRAAEIRVKAGRLASAAQGKGAYYNWVRARLQIVVAEQSLEQSKAALERARLAQSAGRASQADVLSAEAAVANSEYFVEQTKSRERLAEQQVRILTHDPGDKPYSIGEDVLAPAPATKTQSDIDALFREARQRRLEVQAINESIDSINRQDNVVEARQLPRIEAFGNVYYARPNQRFIPQQDEWNASWDAGIQVTWSPNDMFSNGAQSTRFETERRKLEIQRDELMDGIRQEVTQAAITMNEAQVAVASAKRGLVAAEKAHEVQKLLYDNGRSTSLELLQVQTQLLRARVQLVDALINVRVAQVALEHAVGRDVQAR